MTLIASHRGGRDLWPENSRLAFRHTAEMDVDLVEFDVHQTRDEVLVVHHDATIDRMTSGHGPIGDMTYEELSRHIIIGTGGETIPTLVEVIDIMRPSKVNLRVEIKARQDGTTYDNMERHLLRLLSESGMATRSMITSFQLPSLEAFLSALDEHGLASDDLLGALWLCSPSTMAQLGFRGILSCLSTFDVREIGLRADAIDDHLAALFDAHDIKLHAWAAHTSEAARTMFRLGIASFTSDRPDLAIAARSEHRSGLFAWA
ncbi:glycerophosphodiester phosphodiesterase [Oryzifoliimicrobium ureilyticus]|uniref:glycerophosphodiester phosphodiesterase n=1 Tax=Oryzifoliimicrobium ureilyticus TaxID=3113724 RepID=UPI00307633D0